MENPSRDVVINDSVHGHIRLSHDLKRIVDTPQIQRLRELKQLGLTSYVYPGATHTRFAHSLGVCYLAGVFLGYLRQNENGEVITDRDIFLVQVAGLCHDLGHGPYSHLFQEAVERTQSNWKHEEASKQLFEKLVRNNGLNDMFSDEEIRFIKELIDSKEGERRGHPNGDSRKEFLYEVVSNERTSIDVDKFDYFLRDCQALGFTNMFNCHRFMRMARLIHCDDGKTHICVRDKELENLVVMFQTRFFLHLNAYRHPVVCGIDIMVCEILEAVRDIFQLQGDDGQYYKLFDSVNNSGAFSRLDDSILTQIGNLRLGEEDAQDENKVANLRTAQDLIARLNRRRFYKFVFQTKSITDIEIRTEESIRDEIWSLGQGAFIKEDICVKISCFNFCKGSDDPLEQLYVFSQKERPLRAKRYEQHMVSDLLLPRRFSQRKVQVYCRADDKDKADAVRAAAEAWQQQNRA